MFVSRELEDQIARKTGDLIKSPTERSAGYIQGLQAALALLAQDPPDSRKPPTQEKTFG